MINVTPAVSAINTAFNLLGGSIVVRSITGAGTFDQNTGAYAGRTVVDRTFSGVVAGRESKWVNGTLVTDAEFTVYLKAATGVAKPANGQFVLLDGEEVAIQRVDEYQLAGTDLAYRVVLVR